MLEMMPLMKTYQNYSMVESKQLSSQSIAATYSAVGDQPNFGKGFPGDNADHVTMEYYVRVLKLVFFYNS